MVLKLWNIIVVIYSDDCMKIKIILLFILSIFIVVNFMAGLFVIKKKR